MMKYDLSVSYWEAREDDSNNVRLPPFIVAVLSTEQQTTHLIQLIESSNPTTPDAEEELLKCHNR